MRPNPRLIPRLDVEFGFDDFRLAQRGDDFNNDRLETSLSRLWPKSTPLFVDSGRSALFLALRALGLGGGARVGVPLYTCDAVFEAIVRAGCMPVYVDVDPDTLTMSPDDLDAKAAGLDAIVPIHTFGHPADLDAIRKACPTAKVVEDCAHAVGTRYRGQVVGTMGDAGFFSFRPGKPLSVGSIGMLLCRDPEVAHRANEIADRFPRHSKFGQTVDALKTLSRSALYRRPWFGLFALPVGSLVDERLDLMAKGGFSPFLPPCGLLAVLVERLNQLDWRIKQARKNASVFVSALEGTEVRPAGQAPWAFHTFFQFAIRFRSTNEREEAVSKLAHDGIDSIRFYHDSPAIAANRGYLGSCEIAEHAAQTVLTIPCHSHLGVDDVERIAESLHKLGGPE
jgi:perosamine synthetase